MSSDQRSDPAASELDELVSRLGAVEDPALFHPLAELGLVRGISRTPQDPGRLRVVLALPPGYPDSAVEELRSRLQAVVGWPGPPGPEEPPGALGRPGPAVGLGAVGPRGPGALGRIGRSGRPGREERAEQIEQVGQVELATEAMSEEDQQALGLRLRDYDGTAAPPSGPAQGHGGAVRANPFGARRGGPRVLAICSGKGGVGKSSITVNLAVALAAEGARVGVLDADIYGFSVPRMLGVDRPPLTVGRTLVPPVAHGVRVISMGFFVDEDRAVAWRGPMLHKALEQFLVDVHWGPLDYLVVDMPPGTGDVPLSVAQQLPGAECYVVTTPQPAAQRVAQRAAALAREVRLPVRGVIENLSFWVAPDGRRHELFGSGGGQALADSLDVPLLARLPLETEVRVGADEGLPAVLAAPKGEVARLFGELAARIAALGPARVYRSELKLG